MKKIILTPDVENALGSLYDAAMKFAGYPVMYPHWEKIVKAVVDETEQEVEVLQ